MNWTQALSEALKNSADKVPKGFKTRTEIAKELGKSDRAAREAIAKLVKLKKAEAKKFRVQCGESIRLIPHYRLI